MLTEQELSAAIGSTAYGPDGEIYVVTADGAESKPVAGAEFGDELLQWSADGLSLYVRARDDSRLDLYRLDLNRKPPWVTCHKAKPRAVNLPPKKA